MKKTLFTLTLLCAVYDFGMAQGTCQGATDLIPSNQQQLIFTPVGTSGPANDLDITNGNKDWNGTGFGTVVYQSDNLYFQEDGTSAVSLIHAIPSFPATSATNRANILIDFLAQNVGSGKGGRPMEMAVIFKGFRYATIVTQAGNPSPATLSIIYANGATGHRSTGYGRETLQLILPSGVSGGGDFWITVTPQGTTADDPLADDFKVYSIKFQTCSLGFLPAAFDKINAGIKNDQLKVNWTTLSETNCDHFVITASHDGKNFLEIGQTPTKSLNSHSTGPLQYEFTKTNIYGLVALGGLSFLIFAGLTFSTHRRYAYVLSVIAMFALGYGCSKGLGTGMDGDEKEWYIQILQVGKDGRIEKSSIKKALPED